MCYHHYPHHVDDDDDDNVSNNYGWESAEISLSVICKLKSIINRFNQWKQFNSIKNGSTSYY